MCLTVKNSLKQTNVLICAVHSHRAVKEQYHYYPYHQVMQSTMRATHHHYYYQAVQACIAIFNWQLTI